MSTRTAVGRTPAPGDVLDCGHVLAEPESIGAGYATTTDGRTLCYGCADSEQAAEMATADTFTGYVSGEGRTFTTWSGGVLARVTYRGTDTRDRITPTGGRWRAVYVRATTPDGAEWRGTGSTTHDVVTLRRLKPHA